MSKVINLFGGPGIGKSSIAAGLTYKLKKKHISCDNPYEFPKLLAWDNNGEAIKDQLYVLANQHRGITKSWGKVDYLILDSPILLSLIYRNYYDSDDTYPQRLYGESFDKMVLDVFNQYDNINIVLERSAEGDHNEKERYQTLDMSRDLDNAIDATLVKHKIPHYRVKVGDNTLEEILKIILE
jgi:deoxyadenosine/deoxycytidine kinase